MGQVLSEPVTTKTSTSGQDARFAFAVSEMQGWRLTMEDAHSHILDIENPQATSSSAPPSTSQISFFAVYDGHGGSTVARFAGDTVHQRLRAQDQFKAKDYPAALKRTFLATDEDMRASNEFRDDPSGCTAVAVLAPEDGKLYCANAGDSRSVLSINGEVKPLSDDHKPVNRGESARITAAGGFVEFGRVNGNLALSRALGDFEFKQNTRLEAERQVVTADPDVSIHEISNEDEFFIVACDGIWDVLSSQTCVDIVRRLAALRTPLEKICEEIMDRCLAPDSDCSGVGCDNMTIMIVAILNGKTLDEWYSMMARRVESKQGYATPELDVIPNQFARRGGASSLQNYGSLRGNSLLDHLSGEQSQSNSHDNDDDEADSSLLASLGSALRCEGISIDSIDEAEDSHFESMDIDSHSDGSSEPDEKDTPTTKSDSHPNAEIPHPSVQSEGLLDKSEDPTKSQ